MAVARKRQRWRGSAAGEDVVRLGGVLLSSLGVGGVGDSGGMEVARLVRSPGRVRGIGADRREMVLPGAIAMAGGFGGSVRRLR